MSLLRNLARRKLRTALTIVGITVGIWALVVMTSMADKIQTLVEGNITYYDDKIVVSDANVPAFQFGLTPIPLGVADAVAGVPGVAVAVPQVLLLLDTDDLGSGFGSPDFVLGVTPGADQGFEVFEPRAAQGRLMSPEDEGRMVVVIGADMARKFDKSPGDTFRIRGRDFEVIGVMEPTLTTPDTTAVVSFEAGQALLAKDAPILAGTGQQKVQLVSRVLVYPETDADVDALARAIEQRVPDVQATTADDFDQAFGSTVAIFNGIILGVALISLIVGGLSVINTMAMSVAERTREIGIKRSIGASRGSIMGELMTEAAFMGLVGGVIGLALGAAVVYASNEAGRTSGTILFLLTPWTALFAVAFSTVLGGVAGVVPAWKAARLDPVVALRYE